MAKAEESSKGLQIPVKLVLKRKGFEIIAEGPINSLYNDLDAIEEFTDKVAEKFEIIEETTTGIEVAPSPEEIAKTPTADIPVIKASKSTIGNLDSLFNTPWGKTPRSFAEIVKALEVNAVPDQSGAISRDLFRLVQKGKLRRIEKEGKWTYFKIPE